MPAGLLERARKRPWDRVHAIGGCSRLPGASATAEDVLHAVGHVERAWCVIPERVHDEPIPLRAEDRRHRLSDRPIDDRTSEVLVAASHANPVTRRQLAGAGDDLLECGHAQVLRRPTTFRDRQLIARAGLCVVLPAANRPRRNERSEPPVGSNGCVGSANPATTAATRGWLVRKRIPPSSIGCSRPGTAIDRRRPPIRSVRSKSEIAQSGWDSCSR